MITPQVYNISTVYVVIVDMYRYGGAFGSSVLTLAAVAAIKTSRVIWFIIFLFMRQFEMRSPNRSENCKCFTWTFLLFNCEHFISQRRVHLNPNNVVYKGRIENHILFEINANRVENTHKHTRDASFRVYLAYPIFVNLVYFSFHCKVIVILRKKKHNIYQYWIAKRPSQHAGDFPHIFRIFRDFAAFIMRNKKLICHTTDRCTVET